MRYIVSALLLAAWLAANGCRVAKETEADAQQPVEIQAATAQRETLRPTAELVGVLEPVPERVAYVAAQTGGQVQRVVVEEGQAVNVGEPIVVLDERMAVVARAKAQAGLDEAKSALDLLARGPLPQEVEAARQEAQTAAATVEGLRAKLKALAPLHARKEISPVQYQQAEAALGAEEAAQAAAVARLKLIQSGTRPESLAEARAKVASAEADLASQDLAVNLGTLTSPIDGVVTELSARPGMAVQPSDRLATVMDLSTVFVRIHIPSTMNGIITEAAAVEATPDATGKTVEGKIARIARIADPQTGEVEAFALLPNPDGRYRPGASCRLRVALPEIKDAVVVPVQAVADHDGKSVVTLVREDKAYETEVSLGPRTADLVQIVEGVSPGDVVALDGGYGLPDGCPVIMAENPKALDAVE